MASDSDSVAIGSTADISGGEQPPLVGQQLAVQYLQAGLRKQRLAPAYLFSGPAGVGRAIAARWFARALLCPNRAAGQDVPCGACSSCRRITHTNERNNHPDLLWVEPTYKHQGKLLTLTESKAAGLKPKSPPQVRLDQVRAISQFAGRTPLESSRSVIVMTAAETLAEAAANALLKTLEEPRQSYLILLATDAALLLTTIVSRCQLIPFRRLAREQVVDVLAHAGAPVLPDFVLDLAQGSPGQAQEMMEVWESIPPELLEQLQAWPRSLRESLTLGREIAKQLDVPRQLWLIEYLQQYCWQQSRGDLVARLEKARTQLRAFVQPQLVWEMTLRPIGDRPSR